MLFDQSIEMGKISQLIGRQNMFQFQPVNAGGIGYFNIKMIIIVVVFVYNPDSERVGISKCTIVNAGNVQVGGKGEIAFGF